MSSNPGGASPRLTYVIGTYPSLTTTFIDREIETVLGRDVDVRVISVRRPHTDLSARQRELQRHVTYLLPLAPRTFLRAALRALWRQPLTTLRHLAYLLTRPHSGGSRLKTALHFAAGVYAAYLLRDRAGVPIHAHFVDRAAIIAQVAGRLLGSRYSVTAHANDIYVRPVLLREKFEDAAVAVTCTEANKRHLEGTLGARVGRKVLRIYHGIPLGDYVHASRTVAAGPAILAVGQLKEKKGLRYLVEAVAAVTQRFPDVRCEIVGEGPLRAELQSQIDRLGLGAHVHLLGALPHASVVAKYAAQPIFVAPSVVAADGDRDGIPNVVLEAMASRLAVIASAVSGIPEAVRHNETGILVPPGDAPALAAAIERVLSDAPLRAQLGDAGRALVVRDFALDQNIDRFLGAVLGHG